MTITMTTMTTMIPTTLRRRAYLGIGDDVRRNVRGGLTDGHDAPMAADFRRSGFSSDDGGRRVSIGRSQFADTANYHDDSTRPTDATETPCGVFS